LLGRTAAEFNLQDQMVAGYSARAPLGGSVRPWPSTATNAFIERVGGKIGTAGPDNGSALGVGLGLGEALGGASSFENGSPHALEHVDLTAQTVGKGQPEDAVADDLCGGDIGG
jgi:hypothetical protein